MEQGFVDVAFLDLGFTSSGFVFSVICGCWLSECGILDC